MTSVSNNFIDFQLKFEDALLVSNGDFGKHTVKVRVNQSLMFVTDSGALLDPSYFTLASPLPLQYEEGSIIEVLAETSEKVG